MALSPQKWLVTGTLLAAVALGLVLIGLRARTGDLALRIRIVRAVNEGRGVSLDMNDMAAFTWDSLRVLKPGTPLQVQSEAAGLPWYTRWVVGLHRRNDICVLAFKLGPDFRTHVVLERKAVDCLPAARPEAYSNETAIFDVLNEQGRFSLAPAAPLTGD